jgi:hypothetical protein
MAHLMAAVIMADFGDLGVQDDQAASMTALIYHSVD